MGRSARGSSAATRREDREREVRRAHGETKITRQRKGRDRERKRERNVTTAERGGIPVTGREGLRGHKQKHCWSRDDAKSYLGTPGGTRAGREGICGGALKGSWWLLKALMGWPGRDGIGGAPKAGEGLSGTPKAGAGFMGGPGVGPRTAGGRLGGGAVAGGGLR